LCEFIVCLHCTVRRQRLCNELIPCLRSPHKKLTKEANAQQWAVEPLIIIADITLVSRAIFNTSIAYEYYI
jgi:hypothetical protein